MSNEFVFIPLTNENFENVTSIPSSSSGKIDPRCPLQPSALLKCICNEQMRKKMKDDIDKDISIVRNNPLPNYPMGCGDLSNYDLTPSRDCPICSVEQIGSVEQKKSTITEPVNTKPIFRMPIKQDFVMPPEIINNLATMCKIITDGTEKSVLQAFKNIITSLNITIPPDVIPYFNGSYFDIISPSIVKNYDVVSDINFLLDLYQEFINERNICLDYIKSAVLTAYNSDPSLFNINLNSPNQKLQEIVKNTIKSTCTNQKMLCPMIAMSDAAFKSHLNFGAFLATSMFPIENLNEINQKILNPSFNQRWFFVVIDLIKNMEVIGFVFFFMFIYSRLNPLDNYFGISRDRIYIGSSVLSPLFFIKEIKDYLDENFINTLLSQICSNSDCSYIYNYLVIVIQTLMSRDGYETFRTRDKEMITILNNKNFKNRVVKMFKMNSNTVTSFVNFYNNLFNIFNDKNAMVLINKPSDQQTIIQLLYTYILPVFESLVSDLNGSAIKTPTITLAPSIAPRPEELTDPKWSSTIVPTIAPAIAPTYAPSPAPAGAVSCSSDSFKIGEICVSYQTLIIVIVIASVLLLLGIFMSMSKSKSKRSYDDY